MTVPEWSSVIKKIGGVYHRILDASRPEPKDGTLTVKVPGSFYAQNLKKNQDVIGTLASAYGISDHSKIRFESDTELANAFTNSFKESAPLDTRVIAAAVARPAPPADDFTYFKLADNLVPEFHPDKDPYVVTSASHEANDVLKARTDWFPITPGENTRFIGGGYPLHIWGDVGQGKTHLLQRYAWTIHDKILKSSELLKKKDFDAARELFNASDASNEDITRLLERAANSRVRYVTGELLTDEHRKIIDKAWEKSERKNVEPYKRERDLCYAGTQWLFIDDIQALVLGEKLGTVEWLYNIANTSIQRGHFLVSASDRSPVDLESEVKNNPHYTRMLSRLRQGGIIEFGKPTFEDLVNVFKARLKHYGLEHEVDDDRLEKLEFDKKIWSMRDITTLVGTINNKVKYDMEFYDALKHGLSQFQSRVFRVERKKKKKDAEGQAELSGPQSPSSSP